MRSADSVRDRLRLPTLAPGATRGRRARRGRRERSLEEASAAGSDGRRGSSRIGRGRGHRPPRCSPRLALDLKIGKPCLHRPLEVRRGDDHSFSFCCLGQRASPSGPRAAHPCVLWDRTHFLTLNRFEPVFGEIETSDCPRVAAARAACALRLCRAGGHDGARGSVRRGTALDGGLSRRGGRATKAPSRRSSTPRSCAKSSRWSTTCRRCRACRSTSPIAARYTQARQACRCSV